MNATNLQDPDKAGIGKEPKPWLARCWAFCNKPSGRFKKIQRVLRWVIYPLAFIGADFLAILGSEWGVQQPAGIPTGSFKDFLTPAYSSAIRHSGRIVLNLFAFGVIYFLLIALINRFWVATGLFGTLSIVYMVANRIKVSARTEPVLPTDLSLFSGNGQAQRIGSFIPPDCYGLIGSTVLLIVFLWIGCFFVLRFLLGPGRLVHFKNRRIHWPMRLIALILPILALGTFTVGLSDSESGVYHGAHALGDTPDWTNPYADAQSNGPLIAFLRLAYNKPIARPANYSARSMKAIAAKYEHAANRINNNRSGKITDNTVITVLSESFSDPMRVPGIRIEGGDPMPKIRSLKQQTTSGVMLSSGYGGGTSSLEFQELTGTSTALLSASTVSPYLQLVPHESWAFSFNQMWGKNSIAIHPYSGAMYQRASNFINKFDFSKFYTLDGPQYMKHRKTLDKSSYVSDAEAYQETVDRLTAAPANKQLFVQLSTMQNHMPYQNQWSHNQFTAVSTTGTPLSDSEAEKIRTVAKGFNITDTATANWLKKLDSLSRPITVIWYGDHLPGAYDRESTNTAYTLQMHETDYFIWSNEAARKKGAVAKLPADQTSYISPNFFMALACEQMNVKVSPYLAFLTQMHQQIPAMEPALQGMDWYTGPDSPESTPGTYLDKNGKQISHSKLTAKQKELLSDYRAIIYDMTSGKHYLRSEGFTNARP